MNHDAESAESLYHNQNSCMSTLPMIVKYKVIHKSEIITSEKDQNHRSVRVLYHRFFFFGPRVEALAPRPLPAPRPLVPLPRPLVGFGDASYKYISNPKYESGKM